MAIESIIKTWLETSVHDTVSGNYRPHSESASVVIKKMTLWNTHGYLMAFGLAAVHYVGLKKNDPACRNTSRPWTLMESPWLWSLPS